LVNSILKILDLTDRLAVTSYDYEVCMREKEISRLGNLSYRNRFWKETVTLQNQSLQD